MIRTRRTASTAPRPLTIRRPPGGLVGSALHSGAELVRPSAADGFSRDPIAPEPTDATLVDEAGRGESRLFGQGADLRIARLAVERRPAAAAGTSTGGS